MNKQQVFSYAKILLKIAVAVAILVLVYSKMDTQDMWEKLTSSNVWLLLVALIMFTVSKIISSFRLTKFFRVADIPISEKENLKLYLLGMYYNLFIPGGIGGDGFKVFILNKRYQIKAKKVLSPLFLDRANGLFSLGIMIVLMGFVVEFPEEWHAHLLLAAALPVGILFAYLFVKKLFKPFVKVFFVCTWHSIWVQTTQVIAVMCILYSLGIESNYPVYLLLFLVSSIVSIVPVTPGGAGLRELTFTLGATVFAIDTEVAVVTGSLFFFITALVSLGGVYYHFNQQDLVD